MTPDQWWCANFNLTWWNWAKETMISESVRLGDVSVVMMVGGKPMAGYVPTLVHKN